MRINVLMVPTLIVRQGKHKEGGNESHEKSWIDYNRTSATRTLNADSPT